jgi:arginase
MHGMPVAASLGIDNILPKGNQPHGEAIKLWNNIKTIGGLCPKIKPENIVYIGMRDTEWQERKLIDKLAIKKYDINYVRKKGGEQTAKSAIKRLSNCDLIYVSFDVDVLDTSLSLGTGTPVPNGLFLTELLSLVSELSKSEKMCCFEIVEINPTIDNKGNSMAEIGLNVLEVVIQSIKIIS